MEKQEEIQLAGKYQIKEYFWEDEIYRGTTAYRNKVWSALDRLDADIKYKGHKENIKHRKQQIIRKMKPQIEENEWSKVLQTIENREVPDEYFEKHQEKLNLHQNRDYRTQVIRDREA
jgi:hypothetical protein